MKKNPHYDDLDPRLCKIEDLINKGYVHPKLERLVHKETAKRSRIDTTKLRELVEHNNSWQSIADSFGVSVSCLRYLADTLKIEKKRSYPPKRRSSKL